MEVRSEVIYYFGQPLANGTTSSRALLFLIYELKINDHRSP